MLIKYDFNKMSEDRIAELSNILKDILKYSNKMEILKGWAWDKYHKISKPNKENWLAVNQIIDNYELWLQLSAGENYTQEQQELEYSLLRKMLYIVGFNVIQLEDLLDNYEYTLKGSDFIDEEKEIMEIITEYFKIENL